MPYGEPLRTIEDVLDAAQVDDFIDQATRNALRAELDDLRDKARCYDELCK